MLTIGELRACHYSVLVWNSAGMHRLGDNSVLGTLSPVYVLARLRAEMPPGPRRLDTDADCAAWERELNLEQRNAIAHAFLDWFLWLRSKGLEMGIVTAILNGKRNDVLALIEGELNEQVAA